MISSEAALQLRHILADRQLEPFVRTSFAIAEGFEISKDEIRIPKLGNGRLWCGMACCIILPLIPLGLLLLYRHFRARARRQQLEPRLLEVIELIKRAKLRLAYPVMVNSGLFSGELPRAAGLVIACLDDLPGPTDEEMVGLVRRMCDATFDTSDPMDRELAGIMADDQFEPFRRRRLPRGTCFGRDIRALDLAIDRADLPLDLKVFPWIACLIDPVEGGKFFVVPWRIVESAAQTYLGTGAAKSVQ